jgi:hypothetical protein
MTVMVSTDYPIEGLSGEIQLEQHGRADVDQGVVSQLEPEPVELADPEPVELADPEPVELADRPRDLAPAGSAARLIPGESGPIEVAGTSSNVFVSADVPLSSLALLRQRPARRRGTGPSQRHAQAGWHAARALSWKVR